ncbi:MAG: hypothetical protein C0404_06670 [Verrucomicrobia bacterium]|nr:hypothetical protein [Verrucomicrobiota bacterium]
MQTRTVEELQDRFSGNRYRFGKNGEYEITIARTLEDRKRAWAMVYKLYLEKGYAQPDSDQLWYGMHDALPQTTTFIVTRDGNDIATVTVVFDSEIGLPADTLYRDELDKLRMNGRRLCEVVSLVSNETDRRGAIDVLKHLFKVGLHMSTRLVDATDFVITVNPHHAAYYERKLLFRRTGEIRSYEKVNGAPAALLILDLVTLSDTYREHYGEAPDSLWSHFFEPQALNNTIWFLAENVSHDGRRELLGWFAEKKPAALHKVKPIISLFDAPRQAQEACSVACGAFVNLPAGLTVAGVL